MNIFDKIAKTFAPKAKAPNVEALEALERDASAALEAARTVLESIAGARVDALMAGETGRAEHRLKSRDAEADVADAEAALDLVRERLDVARTEAAEAGRRETYAAAVAAQKAAQAELVAKYAPAVAELRRLQKLVAEADALAALANADLPQGVDRLTETESVRDVPGAPERIIREERDQQWVAVASGTPVEAGRVTRREGRRGVMYAESHIGPRPIPCELIEVQRVTRQPWQPPVYAARIAEMVLPDLKAEPLPAPAPVTELAPIPQAAVAAE